MKRVTGIGGIFFHAQDPDALCAWYKAHLGIDVQDWGGAAFIWADSDGNPMKGTTVWSIGRAGGDQFAPSISRIESSLGTTEHGAQADIDDANSHSTGICRNAGLSSRP